MSFNQDRAAIVLLEAIFATDEKVAKKYGVSVRSVQGWRKRLTEDAGFAAFFATKKKALYDGWGDELLDTMIAGAKFLKDASVEAESLQKKNPDMLRAVAGAVKICAEAVIAKRMLDDRLLEADRAAEQLSGQGDTETEATTGYHM